MTDGTILLESKILMDYAEEAYPSSGYSILPSDPVDRAQMRLAVPIADSFSGQWSQIVAKREYIETDYVILMERLQKIEDFIAKNSNGTSAFAMGT